jgi:DNA-binding GntR family transcriptional regulator
MRARTDVSDLDDWVLADLSRDRRVTDRASAAERAADMLRERMIDGYLRPGTRLAEDALGDALSVSRNTLREAFRLLTHERLVEHRLNRGVFVRRLSPDDVRDVYRLRRLLECGALASAELPSPALEDARLAVEAGEAAAARGDDQGVVTSNMHFHAAIVSLSASRRAHEVMRGVLAELRLVFHEAADPMQLHEPYLRRNRELLGLMVAGDVARASEVLSAYLHDAETQLVAAAAANQTPPP